MVVDQETIAELIAQVKDRADCQITESIDKYVIKMLAKNREAKLTLNFNFSIDGVKVLVKSDATASSQEKHKDEMLEIVVGDPQPDLFDKPPDPEKPRQLGPADTGGEDGGTIVDVETIPEETDETEDALGCEAPPDLPDLPDED